ncbi:hypothetical protein GCM10010255_46460 [Streptomyces coeruleofuscus]|uniref:Uncharacterized protein n=1 Tax=Streptomyces coeruleofuscus TaxID=66879 RepID=A0ABN3IJN2_9ACTN
MVVLLRQQCHDVVVLACFVHVRHGVGQGILLGSVPQRVGPVHRLGRPFSRLSVGAVRPRPHGAERRGASRIAAATAGYPGRARERVSGP